MTPQQPIPVEVRHDDGLWYPGTVRGFRGRRMSVRYTTAPGSTYDRAVDAELVRLTPDTPKAPAHPEG